jgi:DNA-binding NtrC family response regulator
LIADSESATRHQLAVLYMSNGYEVEIATSGEEALSQIEKRDIDLVFIDIRITDLNGVEVATQIQVQDPRVSVIASGYATVDDLPSGSETLFLIM